MKNTLLQFEKEDIEFQHPSQKMKNRKISKNSLLTYSLIFITGIAFMVTIYQSYQACSLSNQLSSIQQEKKDLTEQNEELSIYLNGLKEQYNIFTETKGDEYHKSILNQIFYPHSTDIINTLDELNLLRSWVGKSTMRLVFKSSISGDSSQEFHKKVMKGNAFLFLVKTTSGARFGGYTSKNFEPLCLSGFSVDTEKDDTKSFVFSLDKQKIYKITDVPNALYCDENIAIAMGEGDVFIGDHFLKNKSTSLFPKSFEGNDSDSLILTGGEKEFTVKELEVYQLYTLE